jgi:hypothetical protein
MIDALLDFRLRRIRWPFHLPRSSTQAGQARPWSKWKRPTFRAIAEDAPRWWLCLLLVLSPWAYGTTSLAAEDLLAVGLLVLIGLFVLSLILRRRWPRMHWLPASITFLLLAQGWFMTWNAKLIYDRSVFYFHVIPPLISFLPGTVDRAASIHQMLLITGLFGAFWVAADLASNPRWLDRIWLTISLTGVSLVLLGLAQRVTGAPGIFWDSNLDCGPTFFATYRYHANAGAFINIVFPLIVGRTILALRGPSSDLGKTFWTLASLMALAGAFVNVSRAATAITMLLTAVMVAWRIQERVRESGLFFTKRRIGGVSLLLLVGVGLLIWSIGFHEAYSHWLELTASIATNGRFVVYAAIGQHMLPASGWWGLGPASFILTFPFFTNELGARITGIWEYAHCDYLQTLVEWGIIGALLWFLLFGIGMGRTAWTLFRFGPQWGEPTRVLVFVFLLAVTSAIIHAIVDFPLQIASLQLYVTTILGLVTSLGCSKSLRNDKRRRKASTRLWQSTLSDSGTERKAH